MNIIDGTFFWVTTDYTPPVGANVGRILTENRTLMEDD